MSFITKVQHLVSSHAHMLIFATFRTERDTFEPFRCKLTFHRRQGERVLSGVLDGGSHGVLEELEQDVVEV
jgi:hypothetical protein